MEREIVIEVSNGIVVGVYAPTNDYKVTIINWDDVTSLREKNEKSEYIAGVKEELKDITI